MRDAAVRAGRAVTPLWALVLGPACVHGAEVAQPGSADYWVELQNMVTSEGELNPAFDPSADAFELRIPNPDVRSVTLTMAVAFAKYTTDGMPKFFIDNDETTYSKMEPIQYRVRLDEDNAPFDKVYNFKLADPAGPQGFLVRTERSHNYAVRIMQPANYDEVVRMRNLTAVGSSGKVVEPNEKFTPKDKIITYKVDDSEDFVKVDYECDPLATGAVFDGDRVPIKGTKKVKLAAIWTTSNIVCAYHEQVFGDSTKEKMYTLKFWQPVPFDLNKLNLDLLIEPRFGYCARRGGIKDPAWTCRSADANPNFVVTYTDPHAEVSLKNWEHRMFRLNRGIPRDLSISDERKTWQLVVQGGSDDLSFPVLVIKSAHCNALTCPNGRVHKQMEEEMNAQALLCSAETCDPQVDAERCCQMPPKCTTFDGCPKGKIPNPAKFCKDDVCGPEDVESCCTPDRVFKDDETELFKLIDTDGDGEITPSELHTAVHMLTDKGLTEKEVTKAIKNAEDKVDAPCNGKLDMTEFVHLLKAANDKQGVFELVDSTEDNKILVDDLETDIDRVDQDGSKEVFDLIDVNSNNALDAKELVDAFTKLKKEHTEKDVKDMIDEIDSDPKNGVLDRAEFKDMVLHRHSDKKAFHALDFDRDNFITKKEWADEAQGLANQISDIRTQVLALLLLYNETGCSPIPSPDWMGERVFYDPSCSVMPPRHGGLGCWAAGLNRNCRFCGFRHYEPCQVPPVTSCFDGDCHSWNQTVQDWCKQMYNFTCPTGFKLNKEDMAFITGSIGGLETLFSPGRVRTEAALPVLRRGSGLIFGFAVLSSAALAMLGLRRLQRHVPDARRLPLHDDDEVSEE